MTELSSTPVIRANDGNYFGAVGKRINVRGLHLAETRYDANLRIPSHQHEAPSFFMPVGGQFVEGCDTIRHYRSGEVGFHPPFESHWLTTPTHAARGFAIEIAAEWSRACEINPRWDRVPRNLSDTPVAWTIARLYQELHMGDTASTLVIESLGTELHAYLAQITQAASPRRPRWLNTVVDALHAAVYEPVSEIWSNPDHRSGENPRNQSRIPHTASQRTPNASISLTSLASLAGVTPVALIRTFSRHYACTPGVYLRHLRIAAARQALTETEHPIVRVALDAGFYDQSHFVRAFKSFTGMTPSTYRRLFQQPTAR